MKEIVDGRVKLTRKNRELSITPTDLKALSEAVKSKDALPDPFERYRNNMDKWIWESLPKHLENAAKAGKREMCVFGWDMTSKERMWILADKIENDLAKLGFACRREISKITPYMQSLYVLW